MRMRSLVGLIGLGFTGAAALAAQGGGQDTRPGIAVFAFANGGSYGAQKEDYDALERGMAGMLISELGANPALRVVERENIQRLVDEQNLGASGRVDDQTAAKIGKIVGARYAVMGSFIDLYGDFRVDVRVVNVETSEIIKTEKVSMQREHLFDLVRTLAGALNKDLNLPPLSRQASEQRMSRQIPTEALTYYSRALLYHDRGNHTQARVMFQKAIDVFPEYAEAKDGLQREPTS
ncbi:MAG TPA: CsgG/HfaB family protein [Gemmatimonadales bacterium]|jgi:TolB-like protein|nr:CsgG/HfaB family protein [Gemmatimonadales bacterium]